MIGFEDEFFRIGHFDIIQVLCKIPSAGELEPHGGILFFFTISVAALLNCDIGFDQDIKLDHRAWLIIYRNMLDRCILQFNPVNVLDIMKAQVKPVLVFDQI